MEKSCIEICIISARGLGRSSSLWKPQWYAVGWIDPNNKYCTKIDSSGSPNPTWKTKFLVPIDDISSNLQRLLLTIEVYRRDPIFLREKLQGTATIMLKEFFVKFGRDEASGADETVSFQLRKRTSGKPRGFVDVSIRIFEEKERVFPHSGFGKGNSYSYSKSDFSLAIEDGPVISYPNQPQLPASYNHYGSRHAYTQPPTHWNNHPDQSPVLPARGYRQHPTPPPPPPPSNTGFLPTIFPETTANHLPETYVNIPATNHSLQGAGPGFGMGLGAGALAAGAMIFGDDFLSGASFPAGLDDGGSFSASTDHMF